MDYVPALVYQAIYYLMLWIPPILPKMEWVFEAILSTIMPFFLLLYVRYYINKRNLVYTQRNYPKENPAGIIPFGILLIFMACFTLGAFPIKPIGVATGSMYPNINIGDMVVVKKCTANDLKVGDIVAYQLDGITIVHRITKITQGSDGSYVYRTKGDNNYAEDNESVYQDQILGKVMFKIKYIAFPTIWLRSLRAQQKIGVETGK